MITQPRWEAECRAIRDIFPQWQPFISGRHFGFRGRLYGKRRPTTKAIYAVEIRGDRSTYPHVTPFIFIAPRVGPNWQGNGALCVTKPWSPSRSNFAQLVLYAASYLQEKG